MIVNTRTYVQPRTSVIVNILNWEVSPNGTSQNFGAFDLSRNYVVVWNRHCGNLLATFAGERETTKQLATTYNTT